VEEFLEQRVAEDRDEVHRQDAEQGNASKHVEGFDAVSRFDGHGHRVSLPRSKRREGSQSRSSFGEHAAPAGQNPEQQDAFPDDGCFDPEALRRRQLSKVGSRISERHREGGHCRTEERGDYQDHASGAGARLR